MSAEDAFAQYESVRMRLPPALAAGAGRAVADMSALTDQFDVFLLDAFGVLNIGERSIPDVVGRIASLRKAGKRLLVVTNAASVSTADLVRKYARLGYDFTAAEVVTSRQTCLAAIEGGPPCRWGVMLEEGLGAPDLRGLDLVGLDDRDAPYREATGFLLLGSKGWTEARQARLEGALKANPRPVYCANPDIVAPREAGFTVEPGYFAHRLAAAAGIEPRFFGKPFGEIFELALGRLGPGVNRARVLMVGDSLHTDTLGAQIAGISSALVTGFGFLSGQDAASAIERSAIRPDFILERP